MDSVLYPRFNPSDVFATNGPAAGELFLWRFQFMYVTAFIRVSCSVSLFRVCASPLPKRPVLFADFNQTMNTSSRRRLRRSCSPSAIAL